MASAIKGLTGYDFNFIESISGLPTSWFQTALVIERPVVNVSRSGFTNTEAIIRYINEILGSSEWSATTFPWPGSQTWLADKKGKMGEDLKAIFPQIIAIRSSDTIRPTPHTTQIASTVTGHIFDAVYDFDGGTSTETAGDSFRFGYKVSGASVIRSLPFSTRITIGTNWVEVDFCVIPSKYFSKDSNGKIRFVTQPDETFPNLIDVQVYLAYNSALNALTNSSKVTIQTYEYNISTQDIAGINDEGFKFVSTNPYGPGGTSGGGGGGGSFDDSSNPTDLPGLPNIDVTKTGLINLYNPSLVQLQSFSDYLWSDSGFSVENFKKIFANPMDAILGLSIVPVSPNIDGATEVKIGNVGTGVFMNPLSSQWFTKNFGTIQIPEYWGAYLDYSPYTSLQLYLPYIGIKEVSANDIISNPAKSITLQYNFDLLSGACLAALKCGSNVLYTWQGSCSVSIPITSLTYTNVFNGLLQAAQGIGQVASGNLGGLATGLSGALNMNSQSVAHSGSITSAGGLIANQTPFFIISRPSQCVPENQEKYMGFPSFIEAELSSLKGFTIVDTIHLENIPATSDELTEIESLLKNGVIM